ncbi:serine/arginine repetitive matrix protein 1-like isoform X2 [Pollicipes pollicipes]|uniref:serine/arginine repetitive matrix protein 1-like isoform X2 n=1 Tax=Pollicipes pollicipes TaxID=41117 RepID=UPI0018856767|nr:serine/arginine repetitive matrix protein 1-like isoform X2 [Pollicipes pollicipes]
MDSLLDSAAPPLTLALDASPPPREPVETPLDASPPPEAPKEPAEALTGTAVRDQTAAAGRGTARRRKRRRAVWRTAKQGRRPLYRKPQGRGDGEIEPGNTVEVLFLNNDEGHESYDALDAMVMKVDTDVRPTRYYVHFKDMARRHDRWVTRPEISRVYRSQLLPIQMVEPTSPPASGPSRRKRAPTGSSPEPASRERLPSCECDSQTDPADRPPREASGRAGGSPCRAAAAAALPSPRSGRSTPARRLSFVPELSPPPPAEETGDRPVATGAQ